MTIDPQIQAMLEANPPPEGLPPLDQLPADMVRAGYKMQRAMTDQSAPKDASGKQLYPEETVPARCYAWIVVHH